LIARRRLAAVALAVLSMAAVGACGTEEDLEQKITDAVEKDSGTKVKSVDCPSDVNDAEKDSKYECTVTPEQGEPTKVEVVFVNDDLDFTFEEIGAEAPPAEEPPAGEAGAVDPADEEAITAVIEGIGADPVTICTNATEEFVTQNFNSVEECEAAAVEQPADPFTIEELTVEGDTATVTGSDSEGPQTIGLVRVEDGSWAVDSVQ